MLFPRLRSQASLVLTSALSTAILVIHLTLEGFRFQLVFSYFITLLVLLMAVYKWYRTSASRPRKTTVGTYFLSVFLGISLVLSAALSFCFPFFEMPEPTGPLKIGTQTFHFTDENRKELFSEKEQGKRELMVQLWYPAQSPTGTKEAFIPDGQKMIHEIAKGFGIPGMVVNYLQYIPSHSYEGASISSSRPTYPLIILNHGYGSSRAYHTSQAENLASQGFIVASIGHTYSTLATFFPDGKTAQMNTDEELIGETEYRDWVGGVWTEDISFTINQLEKMNAGLIPSMFQGKIDMENIGVFGHSFGGAAAYDSSYDSRIKAGIDLDGSLYRYHHKEGPAKPFMFIFSEQGFDLYDKVRQNYAYTDQELEDMGTTREQVDKDMKNVRLQLKHIQKVTRFLELTGEINAHRSAFIVNQYVLDFFNKHLRSEGGTLIQGPSNTYPEVKFVSSLFAGEE